MMPITSFKNSGPPISDDDLDRLEEHLDAKLPPAYRAFLRHTNGGRPSPENTFRGYRKEEGGSVVSFFYAVSHERKIFTIAQAYCAWEDRIPRDLLPIAGDAGDNQICIGIRGKRYGKIFFWILEEEGMEGRPPGYRNVRMIADDMDSFLDSFYDYRELDDDDP